MPFTLEAVDNLFKAAHLNDWTMCVANELITAKIDVEIVRLACRVNTVVAANVTRWEIFGGREIFLLFFPSF